MVHCQHQFSIARCFYQDYLLYWWQDLRLCCIQQHKSIYIGNNFNRDALRAWKQPGDITDVPRIQLNQTHTLNDRALVDASYFTIKNFSVGYTFKLQNIGLETIRVFAQGDNLKVFAARDGLNPQKL